MRLQRKECPTASSSSSETLVSEGAASALFSRAPGWDSDIPGYFARLQATAECQQHSNRSWDDDPCKLKDFESPGSLIVRELTNTAASLQAAAKKSAVEVTSLVGSAVGEAKQMDQEELSQNLQHLRSVVKRLKSEDARLNELEARCKAELQKRSDLTREAERELKFALREVQIKKAVYCDRWIEESKIRNRLEEIDQIYLSMQVQIAAADEASVKAEEVFKVCLREQERKVELIREYVKEDACLNPRDEIQDHKMEIASCERSQGAIGNSLEDAESRCFQLEELGKFGAMIPFQDDLVDKSQDLVSGHNREFRLWPNESAVVEDVGPTDVGDVLQICRPGHLTPAQWAGLVPRIKERIQQIYADTCFGPGSLAF